MSVAAVLLPWVKTPLATKKEALTWKRGTKYTIHAPTLESIELEPLLTHCKFVQYKVKGVVSSIDQLGPSYFDVFPRTLTDVLEGAWVQAVEDLGEDAELSVANLHRTQGFCCCPLYQTGSARLDPTIDSSKQAHQTSRSRLSSPS